MEFSDGELLVMEELWKGDVLDENGEIQALALSKILMEKYDISKTSCYTFFGRLVGKGAIARRYPKYTIRVLISREDALLNKQKEAFLTCTHKPGQNNRVYYTACNLYSTGDRPCNFVFILLLLYQSIYSLIADSNSSIVL